MYFEYKAIETKTGERVTGQVEANDRVNAILAIERLGQIPIKISSPPSLINEVPLTRDLPVPLVAAIDVSTKIIVENPKNDHAQCRTLIDQGKPSFEEANISGVAMKMTSGLKREDPKYRYWAFISYSSKDKYWGQWLHRAIETYGIPTNLVARHQTPTGHPTPKRFHPVFRDRDELPAASDLGAVLRQALSEARYLIVICSPSAASSHWVNAEIKEFLALGRRDHILAIIVEGEPNTGDARECFPPEIRKYELIAADARRQADGKTNAKLKLLAGMLGVTFDSLKKRDDRRRKQRFALGAMGMVILAALVINLMSIASHERRSAGVASRTAERGRYATDMLTVQADWEQGNISRFQELLDAQRPERTGGVDHRSFEWYYWWLISHREMYTLKGWDCFCFSPDSKFLMVPSTQSGPGGIAVTSWDVASGREAISFWGCTRPVINIRFSADGKRLFAGCMDGSVVIWNTASARKELTLEGESRMGTAGFFFSPDCSRLATCTDFDAVKVWDTESGRELFALKGVLGVCFSLEGSRLATVCYNEKNEIMIVKIWNATSGEALLTLQGNRSVIPVFCFSPDGSRLACAYDVAGRKSAARASTPLHASPMLPSPPKHPPTFWARAEEARIADGDGTGRNASVWDTSSGRLLFGINGHEMSVSSLTFSADGTHLATGSFDTTKVWDAEKGNLLLTLSGGLDNIQFTPDGKRLMAGSKVWNVEDGKECLALKGVKGAYFSPDGRWLAALSAGTIKVWDAASYQRPFLISLGKAYDDQIICSCLSLDGKRIATVSKGKVAVWDAVTGKKLLMLDGVNRFSEISSVAFSPDNKRIVASLGNKVTVWDAVMGTEIYTVTGSDGSLGTACFSPNGRRLAWAMGGTVSVCDADSGRLRFTIEKADSCICYSPDGERLATGSKILDADSGRLLLSIEGAGLNVCYSPDGRRLATVAGSEITVWDAEVGKKLHTITGPTRGITSFCFSPDGRRLVSGGWDDTVRVWDVESGQELLSLRGDDVTINLGYTIKVNILGFSPDGKRLASSSGNTVKIWEAATDLAAEMESPAEKRTATGIMRVSK